MRSVIESIEAEYRRYQTLAESAMAQLSDDELAKEPPGFGNSIAVLVWHVAGNLESRFTDFRTSDGEKPTRDRDSEFLSRTPTRGELLSKWASGWSALKGALAPLTDADLSASVTIRTQPLRIDQALHRSLAHTAYHVGQIVYLAKLWRGPAWDTLSIPLGGSAAYNQALAQERA